MKLLITIEIKNAVYNIVPSLWMNLYINKSSGISLSRHIHM